MLVKVLIALTILACSLANSAWACPKISGLIDANCDGQVQIAIFGDSIVRGIRDPKIDDETGGYLKDLEKMFPKVTFINGGIPGITSGALYRAFLRNAPKAGKTFTAIGADGIAFGVGINDYFSQMPAQETIRNILRTQKFVRSFGHEQFGIEALTLTINLTNTTRPFQQPWVKSVNSLIRANANKLKPIVPFDSLPGDLIVSEDNLHPDGQGYLRLAKIMAAALRRDYNRLAKRRNIDRDKDGVADWAEMRKFNTDPKKVDTDGDGLSDGKEIFKYFTNPLLVDSDADGIDDATEVREGTNPIPEVTPTPSFLPTPTPTPEATSIAIGSS